MRMLTRVIRCRIFPLFCWLTLVACCCGFSLARKTFFSEVSNHFSRRWCTSSGHTLISSQYHLPLFSTSVLLASISCTKVWVRHSSSLDQCLSSLSDWDFRILHTLCEWSNCVYFAWNEIVWSGTHSTLLTLTLIFRFHQHLELYHLLIKSRKREKEAAVERMRTHVNRWTNGNWEGKGSRAKTKNTGQSFTWQVEEHCFGQWSDLADFVHC